MLQGNFAMKEHTYNAQGYHLSNTAFSREDI